MTTLAERQRWMQEGCPVEEESLPEPEADADGDVILDEAKRKALREVVEDELIIGPKIEVIEPTILVPGVPLVPAFAKGKALSASKVEEDWSRAVVEASAREVDRLFMKDAGRFAMEKNHNFHMDSNHTESVPEPPAEPRGFFGRIADRVRVSLRRKR